MARKIGVIADEILKIQMQVKKLNEQIDDLEKKRTVLKEELKEAATKENLFVGGGKKSKFKIAPVTVPQATDWDAFYEYMAENRYFHLLNKRLTIAACNELWEHGVVIPGVEKFTKTEVTVGAAPK